jgi:hypothetical protein
MKVKDELSVILILDYNERNTEAHYTPLAIVDSATEEMIRAVIARWLASETNLSDDDGIEFLNECVPALFGDNFYQNDDYEVAFKIESAYYYTNN